MSLTLPDWPISLSALALSFIGPSNIWLVENTFSSQEMFNQHTQDGFSPTLIVSGFKKISIVIVNVHILG